MKNHLKLYFIVGLLIFYFMISNNIISSQSKIQSNEIEKKVINSSFLQEDQLEIVSISGGFGRISIDIKNIGDSISEDIDWSIFVEGGIFDRINVLSEDVINSLQPNDTVTIQSNFIIGFGAVKITVNVNIIEKKYTGNVFLFFINVNQGEPIDFEIISDGVNSPIALTHAGDGSNRLFVADQVGMIYVIENNVLQNTPFLDLSNKIVDLDITYDERGLLGLAFHPNYQENGRFFVYYSAPKNAPNVNHESILAEYKVSNDNPNVADINSEKIIFRIDEPEANHNGGQLVFGPDGYLYFGLGDGGGAGDQHGNIGNGQDINTALGSILRIDVDSGEPYSIPQDNPFVNQAGLDEIYSWGFRNPWRFSFDRETDRLFVADVGQDEWEEVNIVEKGLNYGWRILEATHPYDLDLADELDIDIETLAAPINEYSHSLGRSITGGFVYRGSEFPNIIGKYIFGDWSSSFFIPNGKIFYLEKNDEDNWDRYEFKPVNSFNRFVLSFGEDENGELYVLSKTILGPTGTTGDVRKLIFE